MEVLLIIAIIVTIITGAFMYNAVKQDEREKHQTNMMTKLGDVLHENSLALKQNSEVMREISREIKDIGDTLEEVKEDVQHIKEKQENRES